MKAVILAGGEGKRLRPLTATKPKPLMRVGDRSLLDIMLERLSAEGVTHAAVTLGYRGEDIINAVGSSAYGINIEYYTEKEPLGTAGCVKGCEDFIEDGTLVLSADALTDVDVGKLADYHKKKGGIATLVTSKRTTPRLYGVVDVRGDGRIIGFAEKPDIPDSETRLVNCGIYMINRELLDFIPDGFYDFGSRLFPKLLDAGIPLYAMETDGFWCDIGSFSEYRRSNLLTLTDSFFVKCNGTTAVSDGRVTDSIVGRGSRILGNAVVNASVVGRNTRIGSGTRLDSCILGDGVTVGENVSISKGAVVGDFAILGDGVKLTDGICIDPYTVFMG